MSCLPCNHLDSQATSNQYAAFSSEYVGCLARSKDGGSASKCTQQCIYSVQQPLKESDKAKVKACLAATNK